MENKSRKLLEEFVKKDMVQAMKDRQMPEDLIDKIPEGLVKAVTDEMIKYNPRRLYDFFDENNIFMTISKKIKFFYEINGTTSRGIYDTRLGAEREGFNEAFKLMDNEK